MGSRVMHLLVADYVAEELHLEDRGRVLVGSIAPDAHNGQRDRTHFKGPRYAWSDVAPYQYGQFLTKYHGRLTDGFFIGYLSHLITDDVWTTAMDFSGLKERLKSTGAYYEVLYHDYYIANAQLIHSHKGPDLHQVLDSGSMCEDLDELDSASVERLKQEALSDFTYPASNVDRPLAFLTLDLIRACIERAAIRAIDAARPWIG